MNNVNLIGRLTHEVENRRTTTGRVVAKFTLAVDSYGKNEDGNKKSYFFECETWDDLASRLWENLRKGDKVAVNGYLVQYKFERRDGTTGSAVKIVATSCDFLSPKHEDAKPEQPKDALEKAYEEAMKDEQIKDEDVPF